MPCGETNILESESYSVRIDVDFKILQTAVGDGGGR